MSKQKMVTCPNCERRMKLENLKWYAETDADEGGVYVVFVGRCPYCMEELAYGEGYPAPSFEEPLRWET